MAFQRRSDGQALLGGLPLSEILEKTGNTTPCYVYDIDGIVAEAKNLAKGFGDHPHLICYAIKANAAGRIVRVLANCGVGADIVSGGELAIALGSNIDPSSIVFSGVAKTTQDIDLALATGSQGILSIHLESIEEIARVAARAKAAMRIARVSLRVKPGVEVDTHSHIATGHDEAKFGISLRDIPTALATIKQHKTLKLVGLSTHIGSQMTSTNAYERAAEIVCDLAKQCIAKQEDLMFVDLGGGFGIDYGEGCEAKPSDFARTAVNIVRKQGLSHLRILCEPGRSLVGAQAVILTRVIQKKQQTEEGNVKGWLLIDAGMNDLIRPALYQARHRIEPIHSTPSASCFWRVAGPCCESSDDFGIYDLPKQPPDCLVIRDTGAYGFSMASQYNGRSLPNEIFLEQGQIVAIHKNSDVASWVASRLAT